MRQEEVLERALVMAIGTGKSTDVAHNILNPCKVTAFQCRQLKITMYNGCLPTRHNVILASFGQ